jgi:hypothetical protein
VSCENLNAFGDCPNLLARVPARIARVRCERSRGEKRKLADVRASPTLAKAFAESFSKAVWRARVIVEKPFPLTNLVRILRESRQSGYGNQ